MAAGGPRPNYNHAPAFNPDIHGRPGVLMTGRMMTAISGWGQSRVKMYGPAFLDANAAHLEDATPQFIAMLCACGADQNAPQQERELSVVVQACACGYQDAALVLDDEYYYEHLARNAQQKFFRLGNNERARLENPPRWAVAPAAGAAPPVIGHGDNENDPTAAEIIAVVRHLASVETTKTMTIRVFTTGLLAYCKQGTVTRNVLNKVTGEVLTKFGLNINIEINTVRQVWAQISGWFNAEKAHYFFRTWEQSIGEDLMRFRLLIQQSTWTGMTNFTNVKRAMEKFPNFQWNALMRHIPGEFANYQAATVAVAGNPFYGYNRDLGAAKSTNYPNLAHACYRLLVDIGGEQTLAQYEGKHQNCDKALIIQRLITEYRNLMVEQANINNAPLDPAGAAVMDGIRAALQNINI